MSAACLNIKHHIICYVLLEAFVQNYEEINFKFKFYDSSASSICPNRFHLSFFSFRFSFSVFFPFFCSSRLPLSLFPLSPISSPFFFEKGLPHKINYELPLTTISLISFFEKKFKPIGPCSGYVIASLFLPGHYIPAPFFNEFSSLPRILFLMGVMES
jgi:hypothetical protein